MPRSVTWFAITWVTLAAFAVLAEDPGQIEPLIVQLGSADFDVREGASAKLKQLDESAGPALEAARAKSSDPEIKQRLDEVIWQCAPWRGLIALYREYGLPMAAASAPLVRIPASRVQVDQKWIQRYYIGFSKGPDPVDPSRTQILVGLRPQNVNPELVEPMLEETAGLEFEMLELNNEFPLDDWLAVAIQCEGRGMHKLALGLLKTGDSTHDDHMPGPPDLRSRLRVLAWSYWARQLCTPDSDRPALITRMKEVMKKEPYLNKAEYHAFMTCAENTIAPRKSDAGSIDALVDDLTEVTTDSFFISEKLDPHVLKILAKGFDAIPALIEHLDDTRLTRGSFPAIMNAPGRGRKVQDVVRGILSGYGGGSANVDAWHDWSREWWARAKGMGEEAYLLGHVFPGDPRNEWPLPIILTVIEMKYPQHLPSIYRTLLDDRPGLVSWPVCGALVRSHAPDSTKIELLEHALKHERPEIRHTALRYLNLLDPARFAKELTSAIGAIGETTDGPYWRSPEGGLACLAMETGDAGVWSALLSAAKRAEPGLRMQLLSAMYYAVTGDQRIVQRLALLSAFLDDHTIRDLSANPEKFDGPCAASEYPKIEVGNFAALEIAAILNLKPAPKPTWSAADWAELRKRVNDALAKR